MNSAITYAIIVIFVGIGVCMAVLVGMATFIITDLLGQLLYNYSRFMPNPLLTAIVLSIITFALYMFVLIKEAF